MNNNVGHNKLRKISVLTMDTVKQNEEILVNDIKRQLQVGTCHWYSYNDLDRLLL